MSNSDQTLNERVRQSSLDVGHALEQSRLTRTRLREARAKMALGDHEAAQRATARAQAAADLTTARSIDRA